MTPDDTPTAAGSGLGRLLRGWRGRVLLTQEQLAERTGLGVRTIRRLETGELRRAQSHSVRMLAAGLGLSAREQSLLAVLAGGAYPDDQLSEEDGRGPGAADADPTAARPPAAGARVPRQLPADVPGFVGRQPELAQLDTLVSGGDGAPAATVVAITGTAGVGKTGLAVHWAHRVAGRFVDGQLYLDLRGHGPDHPVTAADALAMCLTALGVPGADVPVEPAERAARYRTETAGRRLLVLLDNAATPDQVRPLLPGSASCAVLVTSRNSLAGLVALHGAGRLELDLLPLPEAVELLRRVIGPRVDGDPDAGCLAARCARLPLALRVAGELAVARPDATLGDLVAEFGDQRPLDLLDADGDPRAAVSTVFSWSVRQLPESAAHAFALLGLHPGPDFDAYAVAALSGGPIERARRALHRLARAHLVQPLATGRYGMHDLLRAYAAGLVTDPNAGREAVGRLLDYVLGTAAAAMDGLHPAEADYRPGVAAPVTAAPDVADREAALRWLDAERPALIALVRHAASHGWPSHVVRLSTTLFRYLNGGHHADALTVHEYGRDAARQSGDRVGEAHALRALGVAYAGLGRYDLAAEHAERALVLFVAAGDRIGEARARNNLGLVRWRLGEHEAAAGHLHRALAGFRRAGVRVGEAHVLNDLGMLEERLGRYEDAVGHLREALALSRQLQDRTGEAHALNDLGMVEERLGRYEDAIGHLQEALAQFRRLGDRSGEAWTLDSLGSAHLRLGRLDRADRDYGQALDLFRAIGERDGEAWALNGLGDAARAAGRPADALAHHRDAVAIAAYTGARDQWARAQAGLGHGRRALGERGPAREHWEHALALYAELGMPAAEDVRAELAALDADPGRS